jgi:integrase
MGQRPARQRSIRVGEWIERWLTERRRAPNTLAHEWSHYRTHFGPIRDVPIDELSTYACRAWLDELRYKLQERKPPHGQPHTVQHCYNLLRSSLNGAVEHGLLVANPLSSLPRPRIPKPSPKFLTPEEAAAVLAKVDASGDDRALAVHLMLRLGLRRGEALGLTWRDVDLELGVITIGHQLQRVPDASDPSRTRLTRVAPKTSASVRTLTSDPELLGHLREVRRSRAHDDEALVVCHGDGTPIEPDGMTAWLRRLGQEVGVVCTPHRLRHTAATLMLREDVALPTVGAILGHTDVRTTSVYARVLDASTTEAIAALGGAIGAIERPRRPPRRRRAVTPP